MSRLKQCCVNGCKTFSKNDNINLHAFPSNVELRMQWFKSIFNLNGTNESSNLYVCTKHFEDKCYLSRNTKKLKPGSIPTLFLNNDTLHLENCQDSLSYSTGQIKCEPIFNNLQEPESSTSSILLISNVPPLLEAQTTMLHSILSGKLGEQQQPKTKTFESQVKHKVINGQSREIIASVFQFMKLEANAGAPVINISRVYDRVVEATGVSRATLHRIVKEKQKITNGEKTKFTTPNQNRKKKTSKIALNNSEREVLNRLLVDFHATEERMPTLTYIHKQFCDEVGYQGSKETLRKEVHKLGFQWPKVEKNPKPSKKHNDVCDPLFVDVKDVKEELPENEEIPFYSGL